MANIHSDDGYFSDSSSQAILDGEMDLLITNSIIQRPFSSEDRKLDVGFDLSMNLISSIGLDLMRLMPRKFRNSSILIDYLSEAGIQVGSWLTNVRDMVKLLNARTISDVKYLRYLGATIGVVFPPEDITSIGEMRKNILNAVDWYKVKGTYNSVQILSIIQSFIINLYDMYTDDYETFVSTEWFVGDEDENPPGLDSSYYKSPHFGVEILLNRIYESDSGTASGGLNHLWETDLLDNLYDKIEETRPVHTVPHYVLLLNPKTDEFGNVVEVDGEIRTKVLGDWELSIKYFDEDDSDGSWYFDDDMYFDESSETFIKSITKWVVGTGDPDIDGSLFAIENEALSGTIDADDITISDEKVTFEFKIQKSVIQGNISELGLFVPGVVDKLVVGSVFPKINKDSRVELRVLVEVYRKDLS